MTENNYPIEDSLIVELRERNIARENGAIYVRGSFFTKTPNRWYAPEDKVMCENTLIQNNPVREKLLMQFGQKEVARKKQNENTWRETLKKEDTIRIADTLREIGMPVTELQRVDMLKILRTPGHGLRIDWDALCDFSEDFKSIYGVERVEELSMKHLMGASDFLLAVNNSTMTLEEKELILYVLA